MNKYYKTLFFLLIIVSSVLLYSCSIINNNLGINNFPVSDPNLELINYEKHFVAKDFDELNNIIMSQNSLYEDDLEFYYNKAFLEKYDFTFTPDYSNMEEFYYEKIEDFGYIWSKDYERPVLFNDLVLDNSKLQYSKALLSTPKEILDSLPSDSYEIVSNNKSLNPYFNNMNKYNLYLTLYDEWINELNYGITYVARSFEKYCKIPFELSLDENISAFNHDSLDICPNHLYPEIGHELFNKRVCISPSPEYNYTTQPVVRYTNFEFMYLVGRLYIDNKPIDCLIFIRNSYNIDSKEELLDVFKKGGYYNSIGSKNVNKGDSFYNSLNYVLKSTIKNKRDYFTENRVSEEICANTYTINLGITTTYDDGEIKCFEHGIVFFTIPYWKNAYSDDLVKEFVDPSYLFDYEEIYDEYFNTFVEGMEEVKISYRTKNK